uniref:DUF5641 domain-containing protein n=1 Tax=Panagrolaimus superbus TaxID=310955 RepID=A0A914Y611_9BILA
MIRLIGLVKISLSHAIGRKVLDFHEFHTLISEVETIINTRPISAVDPEYNPNASNVALRPIDFISPQVTANYPPSYDPSDCNWCDKESTEEALNKLYQFTAHIRDQFWIKFAHDYLNTLREVNRHFHQQSKFTDTLPEPGNVVLVEEENIPLNCWKVGIITELNVSDDKCIRTAKVKVPSGRILNRPLCQLYPLEIQIGDPKTIQPNPANSEASTTGNQPASIEQRYNLRPRQKVSKSFFVLALCACFVLGATATECLSTQDLTLIYAENCTSSGFAVFQRPNDSYCWQHIDCGIYHLKDYSKLPGSDHHICSDPCICPAWADDCTFYEYSLGDAEKKSLLNLINDEAPHENDAIVYLIQLHDGTDHVIRQLHLVKEDAVDDILCFGNGSTYNGPPTFCAANRTCDVNASKLCFVHHHEIVFAVTQNGKIPIKAWKTLPAICEDGKITLNNSANLRRVQIQSGNSYTVFMPNTSQLIMELPTALVSASREFEITYWNNHEAHNITHVVCPAIDYCLQIKPSVSPSIAICIICVIFLPGVIAEGEDLSLTAKSQECTVNSHGFASCKISEITQFTASTSRTSTLLMNYEGRPLGSIKITPEVHLTCQKMTHHFTRIVNMKTTSVKICGGKSLCSGYDCAQSTTQITVPSLGVANTLPGNTFCVESCGGWFCKCWTAGEACIYYRNFASPADPRPIEIFSCDGWHTNLILNVTITTQQSTTNRIITLQEGHSAEINKIKISALDVNPEVTPPTTNQVFLNTGKTIAVLNDVGTSAANLFKCDNLAAANNFNNCSLDEACKCHPADGIISCAFNVRQQCYSTIPAHPRLQLTIQEFTLFAAIDMNACSAEVHKLEGCSSCPEGAVADITCTTDFGAAEAHVLCDDMSFPLQCSKNGHFQKITLFFNEVNVNIECSLKCPSKATKIKLEATLKKSTFINTWSKIQTDVQGEPPLFPALLQAASQFLQSSYIYLLVTLGIAAVIAILLLKFLI